MTSDLVDDLGLFEGVVDLLDDGLDQGLRELSRTYFCSSSVKSDVCDDVVSC